ncbi:hypothetical protein DFH28DRAFT_1173234 [Melampsora americana]|nr:hypothetical protein DFH28DRAFT_1173234 [Melampsora americana]
MSPDPRMRGFRGARETGDFRESPEIPREKNSHPGSSSKKRETSSERRARKKEEKASRKLEGRSERRSLREEEDRRAAAGLSVDLNFSVHLHH